MAVESDVFGHAKPGGQIVHAVAATSLNVPALQATGLPEVVEHSNPALH